MQRRPMTPDDGADCGTRGRRPVINFTASNQSAAALKISACQFLDDLAEGMSLRRR